MDDKVIYIHYGNDHYDDFYNIGIKNMSHFEKPIGGLWASRIDSEYGWKEYCKAENFDLADLSKFFKFTLKPGSNVVYLEDYQDLKDFLPWRVDQEPMFGWESEKDTPFWKRRVFIDFEQCVKMGIDAIELVNPWELHYNLYGWDCQCILILNPKIIIPE